MSEKAHSGGALMKLARRILPESTRKQIVALQRRHRLQWPRTGSVNFASLRRLTPISAMFGMERGQPVDRYYIEKFLESHAQRIRGRALELGDASYIRRFGGSKVTKTDVLSYVAGGAETTIVADLTACPHVPSDTFDCIIFTQTLHLIPDMHAALANLWRALRPGGVLLVTVPAMGRHDTAPGFHHDRWRVTQTGLDCLLEPLLPAAQWETMTFGNVLSCTAFAYGLAAEEVQPDELNDTDPQFPLIVAARVSRGRATHAAAQPSHVAPAFPW